MNAAYRIEVHWSAEDGAWTRPESSRRLGEPLFDKLEADLAAACMSLPATKERVSAS